MEDERNHVNREYKDRLFKRIFREKEYLGQGMSIREAIDRAVDECINEGILEKILRENREEVCSMLLTEYDEQAHIESEKKIAREEGRIEGIGQGIQKGENLLSTLIACLKRDGRMDELDLIFDEKTRGRLYKEYHLED